jgi:mRNA interferase MazF
VVKRGEIWLARFDPTLGAEIQKTRPCLIVSPPILNEALHTVIVVPMTTAGHARPFRIPISFQKQRGFFVLDQVRTLDKRRLVRRLESAPVKSVTAVLLTLQEMFAP